MVSTFWDYSVTSDTSSIEFDLLVCRDGDDLKVIPANIDAVFFAEKYTIFRSCVNSCRGAIIDLPRILTQR